MELSHRDILNRLRNNIIEDIDVHNGIMNFLLTQKILNNDDIDKINIAASKSDKAAALLDILPNRGPRAFKYFQESLRPQYPWLEERMIELIESSDNKYITNEMESKRLSIPSIVPVDSPLTVPRQEKTQQLKNALRRLTPESYVILHGMKGFGKSWLVTSILNNDEELVKNLFGNEVYWLKFGCKGTIEDELLIQLNHLHHLITNRTSSTNSGQLNDMLRTLKQYFLEVNHRNALIILDDVWDKRIIDKFDFSCKTLVMTPNIDLLDHNRKVEFIEMKNGFTECESLELFAKALGIEIENLPDEAREIHNECNGMPLLIAMFAAQFTEFKDDMAINRGRWQYYLKALRKKDTKNHVMEKFLAKQHIIFDMCINQLPIEEQKQYKMLAIFDEDVNITPKTLQVLWGMEVFRVEEIMVGLCHKSLAVKQWNANLKIYIYGIHDLLVCHLRQKIVPAELANQHKKFIEKIFRYCNNDYSKLPLDNYCYSYIGHHLEQAQMFGKFEKIYLDFNFIQAKIYNSGLSDLQIDLLKYRKYITNNDKIIEEKIVDLENFLQSHVKILADHRYRGCIDLIQIALNHHQPGFCYNTARDFAQSHHEYLYFSHKKQYQYPDSPMIIEMPTELTTVNFTDDPDQVLIGDKYGQVRQCNGKSWLPFNGHEKSIIIKVIVSPKDDYFLALNNKSTIKRFLIKRKNEYDNTSSDDDDNKISTPREKQLFWSEIHRETKDNSVTTYSIDNQQITDMALSSDGERITACTSKGIIVVWDINGDIISKLDSSEHGMQRIIFAKTTNYIHALDVKGLMTMYESNLDEYVYRAQFNLLWKGRKNNDTYLNDIKIIYFQGIPRLESDLEICSVIVTEERAFITVHYISESGALCKPDTRNLCETNNCQFISATLTHDGRYLITADTDDLIKVWNINSAFDPVELYTARAISLDTYWCNDSHIIISGYKQSIQRFTFCEKGGLPRSIKRPQFDAVMKPIGELDIVAQEIVGNKIGLYSGYELIADYPCKSQQIVTLSINNDASKILYATNKGDVYLCSIDSGITELIFKLSDCSSFVKFLGIENTIVCKDKDELIFWCDDYTSLIRPTNVIDVYPIHNNYAITISRDGNIIPWKKLNKEWHTINSDGSKKNNNEINIGNITMRNSAICYCTLNINKNMLALLNVTCEMILYIIDYHDELMPINIKQYGKKIYFDKKLECCAFSPNGELIAIGMHNGDISIYDIVNDINLGQLYLHCNSVRQLHWAPITIGIPILFSINCDELAAWNIKFLIDKSKKVKQTRTGMTRSVTMPFNNLNLSNIQMSNSQTASENLMSLTTKHDDKNNGNNITMNYIKEIREFWSSKTSKDPNFPALLTLISLPLSCNAKVSVSNDCTKFLSVDVHGSINNITLFNSSERNDED